MGYESRLSGEITISPPLPYHLFEESRFYPESRAFKADRPDLALYVSFSEERTERGRLTIVEAVGIVAADDGGLWKHYKIEEDLQAILDLVPLGRTVEGFIQFAGSEAHDLVRYYARPRDDFRGFEAIRIRGRTVYPLSEYGLAAEDTIVRGR
jgi:hypothetical protein